MKSADIFLYSELLTAMSIKNFQAFPNIVGSLTLEYEIHEIIRLQG